MTEKHDYSKGKSWRSGYFQSSLSYKLSDNPVNIRIVSSHAGGCFEMDETHWVDLNLEQFNKLKDAVDCFVNDTLDSEAQT